MGEGVPDALTYRADEGFRLIEIKMPKGKIRRQQEAIAAKVLLGEQINTVQNELNTTAAQLSANKNDLAAAESAVADLKAEHDAATSKHADDLAAANDSAAKRAAEIAAEAGFHKALPIDGDAPTNHLDTFNSLTGAAQAAYFRANRGAILAEQQARKNQ
jgi:hypothetical protein